MSDVLAGFRDAIAGAGLTPPDQVIPDGKLHRFSSNGARGDDAGWYVLHADGIPAGAFGCWRSGLDEKWTSDIGRELTEEERRANRERIAQLARERQREQQRLHAEAARRAATIWNHAPMAVSHQYLIKKAGMAYGLRLHRDLLVVPVRDADAKLWSLQFIAGDGKKVFLKFSRVEGCYHMIGEPLDMLFIAEGYATAATVHEATGQAVAVAFNTSNLGPATHALRRKYRDHRLVICADNDHATEGNPGLTRAREVGDELEASVAVPECEGTDYNDMARERGIDAVRDSLRAAMRRRAA